MRWLVALSVVACSGETRPTALIDAGLDARAVGADAPARPGTDANRNEGGRTSTPDARITLDARTTDPADTLDGRIEGGSGTDASDGKSTMDPPGVVYYVSSSMGDDASDGTLAHPWKTLAKLAAHLTTGGTTGLLRRGDTWNETYVPQGNGSFAADVYSKTYDETFTAALAKYSGGAEFAKLHALMLSDGVAEPAATTNAGEVCRRYAHADAMVAAREASKKASSWISLGAYGTGARPIIVGKNNTIDYGVHFDHTGFTGGWKISDIDFEGFRVAAIDAERGMVGGKGLWITRSNISNIQGMPVASSYADAVVHDGYPPSLELQPGYDGPYATGIFTLAVAYVFIEDVNVTNADGALLIEGYNDVIVDNVTADHCYRQGIVLSTVTSVDFGWNAGHEFEEDQRALVQNCHILYSGYQKGMFYGTVGLEMDTGSDVMVQDTEIAFTQNPNSSPDGVAIDLELSNVRTTVRRCNIHDNVSAGFLFNDHSVPGTPAIRQTGTILIDNTFKNNGIGPAPGVPVNGFPALTRSNATPEDAVGWYGNVTYRAAPAQFLFSGLTGAGHSQPQTNTPQSNWIFGPSNVVH